MDQDQVMTQNNIGVNLRDHDLLVELKTEMKGVRTDIKEIKDNSAERLNRLEDGKVDKKYLEELIQQDNEKQKTFVSKVEFWPVKMIVYSGAGIILSAVLTAVIYLVINH